VYTRREGLPFSPAQDEFFSLTSDRREEGEWKGDIMNNKLCRFEMYPAREESKEIDNANI
jgi:hypothetical protein